MKKIPKNIRCFVLLCSGLLLAGCSQNAALEEDMMVKEETGKNEPVGEVIQNKAESGKEPVLFHTGQTYSLTELRDAVRMTVKDAYWPNEMAAKEDVEEMTGIRPDQYEECLVERHHVKDNIDQIILVKCKEEEITNIEMAIENYRAEMISSHQDQNINLAKAEASRMEVIADYICFVQLGGDLLSLQNDRDAMTAYCQEQNEKAIDILEKMILQSL